MRVEETHYLPRPRRKLKSINKCFMQEKFNNQTGSVKKIQLKLGLIFLDFFLSKKNCLKTNAKKQIFVSNEAS